MNSTDFQTSPKDSISANGDKSYSEVFKKLYYHLYSNSQVSRAERIIEDISKLLLCKLLLDSHKHDVSILEYVQGKGNANDVLLPILKKAFPDQIDDVDVFSLGDRAIREALSILSPINLHDAPAHILGDAFQAVMGPRLRGDKGQFFTPKSLVFAMTKIVKLEPNSKIVDPACGTGGFLLEAFAQAPSKDITIIGIDRDRDLWRLSSSILRAATGEKSYVFNMNSLDIQKLKELPTDFSPFEADVVLTNPPFGAKIGVTDKKILEQFELGFQWTYSKSEKRWVKTSILRKSQDPQILFLELCVKLLKEKGQLGIVLPEGVFGNRGSGYIWDYVRDQGEIIALLDCPRTTFQPSTDTKTNVLFFEKDLTSKRKNKHTFIGVAEFCGHDRRGRILDTTGNPYPDDFRMLAEDFANIGKTETRWTTVKLPKQYYFVPRYYDNAIETDLNTLALDIKGEITTIGKLVRQGVISINKGHEVGSDAYGTGDIPFVRTSDISNLEINPNSEKGISDEIYERYATVQRLEDGDILLVVDGRYRIGRSAILTKENVQCVVQSHLRIIKVLKQDIINPYELLFILNTEPILHQMRNLVFIQSTLGSIGKRLMELRIVIPNKTADWVKQVSRFEEIITTRSALLSELRNTVASEFEL